MHASLTLLLKALISPSPVYPAFKISAQGPQDPSHSHMLLNLTLGLALLISALQAEETVPQMEALSVKEPKAPREKKEKVPKEPKAPKEAKHEDGASGGGACMHEFTAQLAWRCIRSACMGVHGHA